jgi:hypothetical protein
MKKADGVPQPLKSGGCTIHTGRTLHYTGGNLTDLPRRAYIVNFRHFIDALRGLERVVVV